MDSKTLLVLIIVCASLFFMFRFQHLQTLNETLKTENQTLKTVVPMFKYPQQHQQQNDAADTEQNIMNDGSAGISAQQQQQQQSLEDMDISQPFETYGSNMSSDRPVMIGVDTSADTMDPITRETTLNSNTRVVPSAYATPASTQRRGRIRPFPPPPDTPSVSDPGSGYGIGQVQGQSQGQGQGQGTTMENVNSGVFDRAYA